MFLYRQRYLSDFSPADKKVKDAVATIAQMRPTYLKEEVFYWRKANQIRAWFARTLGTDDHGVCRGDVDIDQLRTLLATVQTVLASTTLITATITNGWTYKDGKERPNLEDGEKLADPRVAMELLPTSSGFFFGSTDYDQYYWKDLLDTQEALSKIISDHDRLVDDGAPSYDYVYDESW